jgi:hypothetical protein
MKFLKHFALLSIAALLSVPAIAQNKVLGQPIKFENPKDYLNEEDMIKFIQGKDKESKEDAWIVVSDRMGNKTYEKPDESSTVLGEINFKDWFFVVDQNEDWIHIIKARLGSSLKVSKMGKDYGWVPKKNMLLWTSGMLDQNTLIHRKAFLLNRLEDMEAIIHSENKEVVDIYEGPSTDKTVGKKNIYEFYFVYKKENDRLLIGKESRFSSARVDNVLVGWIRSAKASEWNTRIALEPCFDEDAFEERKKNQNYRMIGFADLGGANSYANTGIISESKIVWDNDPINKTGEELASDGRRFKGAVVRFPMLQNYPSAFMSGAIGEVTTKSMQDVVSSMNEVNWAEIVESVKDNSKKQENFNVAFVIEGTRQMGKYKQALLNAMDNLEREFPAFVKIKYSVAVYRDTPEEQVNKLYELQELTSDKAKAINFLNQIEFDHWHDNEEYTASLYGLLQTLQKAGFSSEESNLVFLIGNNADYRYNRVRKELAESQNDKTMVDRNEVLSYLEKLDIHMVAIQCYNEASRAAQKFSEMGRDYILSNSQNQYVEYVGIQEYFPGAKVNNPYMPDVDEGNDLVVTNGPSLGKLYKPDPNGGIEANDLQEYIINTSGETYKFVEKFNKELSELTESGKALDQSTGAWSPAIAKEVYRLLNKAKKGKGFSEDDLKKLVNEKYHLYKRIYLAKSVKGAKHPSLSYVLFMPQEDLNGYINTLKRLAQANDSSEDKKREALFLTFTDLLRQFTGNDNISKKDVEQTSLDELSAIMQGIKGEGLVMANTMDTKIGSILSSKKMPSDELNKLTASILAKLNKLESIQRMGKRYEFSYTTSENTYYWIPIDYAL